MSGGSQTTSSTVKLDPKLQALVDNILDYGGQAMERPFPKYELPRIASFTPDQLAGFDMTRQNIGTYQPAMNQAMNTMARFAQGPRIQGSSVQNGMPTTQRATAMPMPTLPPLPPQGGVA